MGLTLTEAATARLAGLVRNVGAGGQYAVVVDIEVAAQRFDGAPPGKGLNAEARRETARGNAERLPR